MLNKDKIEKIFKDQFEDYKQTPSSSVWSKIERKMFFKHFLKYKVLSFNLWNILGVVTIATSVLLITNSEKTEIQKNKIAKQTVKNILINAKNNKPIISDNKTDNIISEDNQNSVNHNIEKQDKTILNKSENQISNTKSDDVISNNLLIHNNISSESTNEEKQNVKLAEPPHAEFSASTLSACEPVAITFLNTSENCNIYHWDFGNGKTSTEKNPTFVFRTAGTYKVTLKVTSGRFSDFYSKKIIINLKPNASFKIRNKAKNLFDGDEIQFSNNSTGFFECVWSFGDNNTSNYTNPSHIYENKGNYKVSLICISNKHCADTAYTENIIIQDSKYKINFPTAFSPDKSGQTNGYWKNLIYPNTIFHPIAETEISNYNLRIYNKYGALVFESKDYNIGWNGYYKNEPASSDVYVWKCTGKFEDGKLFNETGNVTLLYLRNQ